MSEEATPLGVDPGGAPPGTNSPTAQSRVKGSDLTALLRTYWEPYDVKKMRRLKGIALGILMPVLFVIILFLVDTVSGFSNGLAFEYQVLAALMITLVAGVGIAAKLRQMDRTKRGWSFSALQDARLSWDELLPLCRAFLSDRRLMFSERTHRTTSLFPSHSTEGRGCSRPTT